MYRGTYFFCNEYNETTNVKEDHPKTTQEQSFSKDDFVEVHKEIFRTGQAMRVDETESQYRERIDARWQNRHTQLEQEWENKNSKEQIKTIPNEVSAWMSHPKIEEYAERYKQGEPLDKMLKGQSNLEEKRKAILILSSVLVEKTEPESKTQMEEGERNTVTSVPQELLPTENREKLSGWSASYELAKVAQNEGIDLSTLTRKEYVDYAINQGLKIDDTQLRSAVWERMCTSPEEIISHRKEIEKTIPEEIRSAFDQFRNEVMAQAETSDRTIAENIRIRQGTKDSNSWLFFGINNGTGERRNETHKSYLTFKDLRVFTPEHFKAFLEALRDAGYNGDVKTFQDLGYQGTYLNDQVVMHGATEKDAQLALEVAHQFFNDELADSDIGKDEVLDGKEKSYSQILSDKIANEVNRGYEKA